MGLGRVELGGPSGALRNERAKPLHSRPVHPPRPLVRRRVLWQVCPHARDRSVQEIEISPDQSRSEEHTSELQSRLHLVCRLLLEKKKKKNTNVHSSVID